MHKEPAIENIKFLHPTTVVARQSSYNVWIIKYNDKWMVRSCNMYLLKNPLVDGGSWFGESNWLPSYVDGFPENFAHSSYTAARKAFSEWCKNIQAKAEKNYDRMKHIENYVYQTRLKGFNNKLGWNRRLKAGKTHSKVINKPLDQLFYELFDRKKPSKPKRKKING